MRTLIIFLLLFLLSLPSLALTSEPILTIDSGGHKATIRDVIFTSDGRYLVSASADKTVRVWDTDSGELIRIIRGQIGTGHEGKIYTAALSHGDRWLALGGWFPGQSDRRNPIRLIDFRSGEVVRLLRGHGNVIHKLAFSPDGKLLISGGGDKKAKIWKVESGELLQILRGHKEGIHEVSFAPDGRSVVTGSFDDTLRLWRVSDGKLLKVMTGHSDDVGAVSYTPDGLYILSGSKDKTIRLWGSNGDFIKVLARQNRSVASLSVSPDGSRVVTGLGSGSGKCTNNVFSIPDGKKLTLFTEHANLVAATAVSPDGKSVATGGGDDEEIYIWGINSGKVKQKMVGKGRTVWSVGFATDGRSIAWGRNQKGSNFFQKAVFDQSFQLTASNARPGEYDLVLGLALQSETGFTKALETVSGTSIRTVNGQIHHILQVVRRGKVIHEINRGARGGDHRSLTFSPDGQTVISGGSWGLLTSYSPDTGEKLNDFVGHTSAVYGVAVSPDSRFLISGSVDQTVKLWELETGKLLLTIFQGSDNEWVAWIPEGYYTSSLKGDRYIGWHINQGPDKRALYYPVSRFAAKYYAPEVVASYIATGGDLNRAIELGNKRVPKSKRIKSYENIQELLPPAVVVLEPQRLDIEVVGETIRIRAQAKSLTSEPVTDIWVLVNGRRVGKNRGIKINRKKTKSGGMTAELDLEVPLVDSFSRISIIAKNRHTQSEPEIINVTRKQTQVDDIYKPNLYLLSVGVSDYENPIFTLDVAHKDAEVIAEVFGRQGKGLYKKVKSRVLTNKEATRDNILDSLDWLLGEATQRDTSIIFMAGHGLKDGTGNYYFLPHDGMPDKLRRSAVKWNELQDTLVNLPSKVILMVDTCHSGAVTGKRRGVSDITEALRELNNTDSGVVVMTAATGREESQERSEWGHGAFTKAMIEGLQGQADYNKNSIIEIKEIDLYVTTRVKELTGGTQHPTTEIPKTLPNFPITIH